jgi:hypothetical protein
MANLKEDGNPPYPTLGEGVAKYRRRGVICREYGEAVLAAFRSMQRAGLRREATSLSANCASGTFHHDGEDILKAVASKHRAALAACPGVERRARKPEKWREMYEAAMAEKRKGASNGNATG